MQPSPVAMAFQGLSLTQTMGTLPFLYSSLRLKTGSSRKLDKILMGDFIYFYFVHLGILFSRVPVHCPHAMPSEAESPGTGVTEDCSDTVKVLGIESRSCRKAASVLNIEPSLQRQNIVTLYIRPVAFNFLILSV